MKIFLFACMLYLTFSLYGDCLHIAKRAGEEDLSDCLKIGTNLQGRKGSKVIDYVATGGLCSKYCKDDDNCNNWIWSDSMAGTYSYKCVLVESYSNEAKDPNTMTGSKLCQVEESESESCMIKDTNLQGRIGPENTDGVKSWGECAALCKERTSCKAWVWHSESTGSYAEICVTVEGFGGVAPGDDGVMFGFQSCQDKTNPSTTTNPIGPPSSTKSSTLSGPPTPSTTETTTTEAAPSSSPSLPPVLPEEFTLFELECLHAHNEHRKKHQAPDLVLDVQLNKDATEWAKGLSVKGTLEHSTSGAGENLYMSSSSGEVDEKALGIGATQAWYDEVKDYKYSNPGFSMATGHFTQVVWKGSEKLGCGYAVGNSGTYVVARYTPPGNYQGQFPDNVLPKI